MPAGDAEGLFVERAQARRKNFVLNEGNAADVAASCRTVEGLPLAVESAASLIVLMAPRQILKQLNDQLKVLVARDPLVTIVPEQVLAHVQGLLAKYKWPRSVVFWPSVPKSAYGKLVKKDIRAEYLRRLEPPAGPQVPAS